MPRRREIRPEALVELREAATWYELRREGLGAELLDDFERTLSDALARLETSQVIVRTAGGLEVRRFRLTRFDRYAIYIVTDDVPVVVAFEHSSRRPGYWRGRLK